MKKTYNIPQTKVVRLNTTFHLMEASQMAVKGDFNSETVTMGGRSGDFWEDEEE